MAHRKHERFPCNRRRSFSFAVCKSRCGVGKVFGCDSSSARTDTPLQVEKKNLPLFKHYYSKLTRSLSQSELGRLANLPLTSSAWEIFDWMAQEGILGDFTSGSIFGADFTNPLMLTKSCGDVLLKLFLKVLRGGVRGLLCCCHHPPFSPFSSVWAC